MMEEMENMVNWLEGEDLWVRGGTYVRHKKAAEAEEARIFSLENDVACARYEYDIIQHIQERETDPEALERWDARAAAVRDLLTQREHALAEANEQAAYHRAMAEAMRDDLGDKAEPYEQLLEAVGWMEDEEDYEDMEWGAGFECPDCGAIIPDEEEICPRCGWTWDLEIDEE